MNAYFRFIIHHRLLVLAVIILITAAAFAMLLQGIFASSIGGMFLGVIEIMAVAFFPTLSGYRDAFAFVLLIIILLMKPTGLMGEKLEDKI